MKAEIVNCYFLLFYVFSGWRKHLKQNTLFKYTTPPSCAYISRCTTLAVLFRPVKNTKYKPVASPSTRQTVISGCPKSRLWQRWWVAALFWFGAARKYFRCKAEVRTTLRDFVHLGRWFRGDALFFFRKKWAPNRSVHLEQERARSAHKTK